MVDSKILDAVDKKLNEHYFLVKKGWVPSFLGGAFCLAIAMFGISWVSAKTAIKTSSAAIAEKDILAIKKRVKEDLVPPIEKAAKYVGWNEPKAWVRLEGTSASSAKVLSKHNIKEVRTTGQGSYSIYFENEMEAEDYLILTGSNGVTRIHLQSKKYFAVDIKNFKNGKPLSGFVTIVVIDPKEYFKTFDSNPNPH